MRSDQYRLDDDLREIRDGLRKIASSGFRSGRIVLVADCISEHLCETAEDIIRSQYGNVFNLREEGPSYEKIVEDIREWMKGKQVRPCRSERCEGEADHPNRYCPKCRARITDMNW